MLTIGNPEIVIWISTLVDAVGWSCCPDRHDGSRALSPLRLTDFLDGHHFFSGDRKSKLNLATVVAAQIGLASKVELVVVKCVGIKKML